jgi:hypothetical protein
MSQNQPQSLEHHARFDFFYHAVLLPVTAANLIVAIVSLVRFPSGHHV